MKSILHKNMLLAALSGLMITASFPPGRMEWLIWFALVPFLMAIENQPPGNRFRLGFVAGMTHYLSLMYWVIIVLNRYGGLPWPVSLSILMLLSFYLALYFALLGLAAGALSRSILPSLILSLFWVSLEFIRAKILSGFPWCLLGYTQFERLPLIQIADLVGVYGISFLIMFANALIFSLLVSTRRQSTVGRLSETFLFLICLVPALYYGFSRLEAKESQIRNTDSYVIAVIQGNIDQSLKWTEPYKQETITRYGELTLQASASKPQLIIWPETAVPFFFQANEPLSGTIRQIAVESGAHLVFGSPAFGYEKGTIKYFNRAYHLDPGGKIRGYYDKVHLVPFGEYVPLGRFLPFIQRLVTSAGDFTPGQSITPLPIPNSSAGLLICFESIFPEIARSHIIKGADILVNITNDAWYGHSSAPYQTLIMSVFRAIETGRPLARAANTGFSAFIDHRGEIISRSDLFTREIMVHEIQMVKPSLTFYVRFGDLFALGSLILSFLFLIFSYNRFKIRNFRKINLPLRGKRGSD